MQTTYTIFLTVQNQFEKLRVKFCAPIKIAFGFSLATQPHYIWRSSGGGAYQGAFFHMLIAQFSGVELLQLSIVLSDKSCPASRHFSLPILYMYIVRKSYQAIYIPKQVGIYSDLFQYPKTGFFDNLESPKNFKHLFSQSQ